MPLLTRTRSVANPTITAALLLPPEWYTLDRCLFAMDLSFLQWLDLMAKMAEFMATLHHNKLTVCMPIEKCMLVDYNKDKREGKPLFFYFQPFEALCHQFSLLT